MRSLIFCPGLILNSFCRIACSFYCDNAAFSTVLRVNTKNVNACAAASVTDHSVLNVELKSTVNHIGYAELLNKVRSTVVTDLNGCTVCNGNSVVAGLSRGKEIVVADILLKLKIRASCSNVISIKLICSYGCGPCFRVELICKNSICCGVFRG